MSKDEKPLTTKEESYENIIEIVKKYHISEKTEFKQTIEVEAILKKYSEFTQEEEIEIIRQLNYLRYLQKYGDFEVEKYKEFVATILSYDLNERNIELLKLCALKAKHFELFDTIVDLENSPSDDDLLKLKYSSFIDRGTELLKRNPQETQFTRGQFVVANQAVDKHDAEKPKTIVHLRNLNLRFNISDIKFEEAENMARRRVFQEMMGDTFSLEENWQRFATRLIDHQNQEAQDKKAKRIEKLLAPRYV